MLETENQEVQNDELNVALHTIKRRKTKKDIKIDTFSFQEDFQSKKIVQLIILVQHQFLKNIINVKNAFGKKR